MDNIKIIFSEKKKYLKCHYLGQSNAIIFLFQALLEITMPLIGANRTQSFSFPSPFCRSLSYAYLHYNLNFIQKYYVIICTNHHFFGFCFCILKLCKTWLCMYTASPKSKYVYCPIFQVYRWGN